MLNDCKVKGFVKRGTATLFSFYAPVEGAIQHGQSRVGTQGTPTEFEAQKQ
jgi:hypothetical protein